MLIIATAMRLRAEEISSQTVTNEYTAELLGTLVPLGVPPSERMRYPVDANLSLGEFDPAVAKLIGKEGRQKRRSLSDSALLGRAAARTFGFISRFLEVVSFTRSSHGTHLSCRMMQSYR